MKKWFPRKRLILAFHKWLGILSAVFLVILSLTGLALNHTERLGLNNVTIDNAFILKRYGMQSGSDIQTYRIHETATLSHLENQLFYNGEPLANAGPPVGILEGSPFTVIATPDQLVYLTESGELIEQIRPEELPYDQLLHLGRDATGNPVLVAASGQWQPDPDWLEFLEFKGPFSVNPLSESNLDPDVRAAILANYQGRGPTLYRVILDLHAGRLFGWGGRTLMDLSAIAILLLVSSGISGWLRRSSWSYRTK
ncbi:PepSY domain-containing protein [Puniceicoccales bacterium CK1056]|uniref:PepSY domain-containing protein n=1 Tax=Oceanipulchritudo coccoides TaxID=2706888 RepID=A0A6B2M1F3_9BACT|nr:PepSY-associated TM helix domain-containing protein [Oceanipulchritudo coccoides]NDV61615.1 PepSY domain-containing protein [Oceanipulchritudo coccoides]